MNTMPSDFNTNTVEFVFKDRLLKLNSAKGC